MAGKSNDNTAPYDPLTSFTTSFCCNPVTVTTGTLSSTSYGSCVGLVLYNVASKIGAVAHFPGSLGVGAKRKKTALADVVQIVREVCREPPHGEWKVCVFGGDSLAKNTNFPTTTVPTTKGLIDLIREQVKTLLNGHLVETGTAPEAVFQTSHVGHFGVRLNLSGGTIDWESPDHTFSTMAADKW
jgi:hypothetical protein